MEAIMEKPMNVCVLVGSLRKASLNGMLANALMSLAPSSMKLEIVEIGQLPFYNQDLETNPPAAQWTAFRQRRAERARFLCSVDFGGPYDGLDRDISKSEAQSAFKPDHQEPCSTKCS